MKAHLMFTDSDFDLKRKLPWNEHALIQDLELNTLFNTMASGDEFLLGIVKKALLFGLINDMDIILYRQNILKDCLKNTSIIKEIYGLSVDAVEVQKKYWFSAKYPSSILSNSIGMMQSLFGILERIKNIANKSSNEFKSAGLIRFFDMLKSELSNEYLEEVREHLELLEFQNGILISAELGRGNKSVNQILRKLQDKQLNWWQSIFAKKEPGFSFRLHPQDTSGWSALSNIRNEGISPIANIAAQSTDHILGFFEMLRRELAFYVGCLNLHEQLDSIGKPISFPSPVSPDARKHSFTGLYDVCLALSLKRKIIGNDVNADNKPLVIITGANQGGKSTFLRSVGLAQLMMQCGMFVPAESFRSNLCECLSTHFKREEDSTMNSGKLDEELKRMSEIVDNITPNSMILFNESFAATNEREGAEIARQIVTALHEKNIKIFFVTHLYSFAHGFYEKKMVDAIFLKAERQADGNRTFKLTEGEPLETSYGEDLYDKIFSDTSITSNQH